jgi:hypothetical protein
MGVRWSVALACACAVLLVPATAAASGRSLPSWYDHEQVAAAGAGGLTVGEEALNTECPGYQSPGVSAAGCIVAPYGCTANFVFTDGSSQYVGTARHCTDRVGQEVTMQVDTTTIAVVGRWRR